MIRRLAMLFWIFIPLLLLPQQNISRNQIKIVFTKEMDSTAFKYKDNFTVINMETGDTLTVIGGGVDYPKQPLQGFTEFIILTSENLQLDVTYKVIVRNVTDIFGIPIDPNNNFTTFITPFRSSIIPKPNVIITKPSPVKTMALINCGSTEYWIDSKLNIWMPDEHFINGTVAIRGDIPIENTDDDFIYQTERYGTNMSYSIPLPNGTYGVRLHFAETWSGATACGQRVFDVNVENVWLYNLDIFCESGGRQIALIKTFGGVKINDGFLDIAFTQNIQNPKLDGIEITTLN